MRMILLAMMLAGLTGCAIMHGSKQDTQSVKDALADPAAAHLARPSQGQIEWADLECEMFICLDPCTWQGREYDNRTTKLSDMKLEKLDVEQWVSAAQSFGAKQIIMVCKHTGGFCWWPTDTTDYCVKNIPWKGGRGNLVKDVADACRKHGLTIGVYVYSDDTRYARGIGRGGRTDDPKKQEEWNAKLRQQWSEVLTICGADVVGEVWFDGGCVVPLKDILDKYAPTAQIFAGPYETIRWPSTESGKLPYPCWSTVATNVYSAGGGNAAAVGDPDGAKWCPPECDTVLYGRGGHNWFWSPAAEKRRHTVDELMEIYLKSVGRGGVLLLNSSPNTDGRIPDGDVEVYKQFGAEIKRRFGSPLASVKGVGDVVELGLGGVKKINQSWIMEDLRGGHRIRAYLLEGRDSSGKWIPLAVGSSVGHKKIDVFPEVAVDKLRLRITRKVGTPIVRDLSVFFAEGVKGEVVTAKALADTAAVCGKWSKGAEGATLDLTANIKMPATYEVILGSAKVKSAKLLFNGSELPAEDCVLVDGKIIVRQTQQVTDQTKTELVVRFEPGASAGEAKIRMISEQ